MAQQAFSLKTDGEARPSTECGVQSAGWQGAMGQTYASDMRRTAYRHLAAAEHLYTSTDRQDVAGYLFGIAAECAFKQIMIDSGMRPFQKASAETTRSTRISRS